MAPFSVNGKIEPPADGRIIAWEMLFSSQGGEESFGQ